MSNQLNSFDNSEPSSMFKDIQVLIMPALIGKKRLTLFESHIKKLGGKVCQIGDVKGGLCEPSHIIVEDSFLLDKTNLDKQMKTLGREREFQVIVGTRWLSDCIKMKMLLPFEDYQFHPPKLSKDGCLPSKRAKSSSESTTQQTSNKPIQEDKFACSQSSSLPTKVEGGNELIIQELQKLADAFRIKGDTWRSHGYTKAISAIKRCGKVLSCYEDAVALPGVGDKIAAKVWEILETGSLMKASEVCNDSKTISLQIFTNIWGVGPSTAENWYQVGCRTLDDVRDKVALSKQQEIGLKHYEDFLQRIPRSEVEEVGLIVSDAMKTIEPSVSVIPVGSYRRGKDTCGDIDIMICQPDHYDSKAVLSKLIISLKNTGLITDDLVSLEKEGNQRKYLGVCCLPGEGKKHRRLDIFVVPKSEEATALMHYTGSALFNRSARLLAAKKGMSLSEHSLHGGIVREGHKVLNSGYIIPTPTEDSIFKALDLQYRPPEERDH